MGSGLKQRIAVNDSVLYRVNMLKQELRLRNNNSVLNKMLDLCEKDLKEEAKKRKL